MRLLAAVGAISSKPAPTVRIADVIVAGSPLAGYWLRTVIDRDVDLWGRIVLKVTDLAGERQPTLFYDEVEDVLVIEP